MELKHLISRAHQMAVDKGWYEQPRAVPELLCLIHSEISEALEAYRDGAPAFYFSEGKPEGLGVELADAIIRICDMAGYLGYDLEEMVLAKMAYNESRPHRHGGKVC